MGIKTFKSTADSKAGLIVGPTTVRLNGNEENYVLTDEKGTTIGGPISFPAGASQIRFGGLWTMNSELFLSLPSTMATPTAVMTIDPPVKQAANLVKEASIMLQLLGMV